jgi:hypothetical protein
MRPVRSFSTSAARPRRRLLLLSVAPLLLVPLVLAACGGTIAHPAGSTDLVLRIGWGGGFVTPQTNLTLLPSFSLYGDGTVIVTGAMIEIYPQPALPSLQTAVISQEAVGKVLAAAKKAGLFTNDVDYGQPGITDVGGTSITINAEGTTYTTSIYALGFEQIPGGGQVDGLTAQQAAMRAKVTDFTTNTGDLDSFLSLGLDWKQYQYTSLAIFSQAADPANPAYDTTQVQPNHLDWPLSDLGTLGAAVQPEGFRRAMVTGADLATLQPLLAEATQITLWKSGAHEYYLYFRPLLPDENAK